MCIHLHWCIRECICVRIGQSCMRLFSSKFFYMAFWAFGKFIAIRPKKHKGRCNSRQLAQHALSFSLPADPVSDSSEGKTEMSWGLKKWGPLKSDWTQVLGWERCFHCGSAGWQFSFFFFFLNAEKPETCQNEEPVSLALTGHWHLKDYLHIGTIQKTKCVNIAGVFCSLIIRH